MTPPQSRNDTTSGLGVADGAAERGEDSEAVSKRVPTLSERDELARLITAGLSQGVSVNDFKAARNGDRSIGRYIAEAILASGFSKEAS